MKKTFVLFCLIASLHASAQIKTFSQLITISTLSMGKLTTFAAKEKWVSHESGKMDSLQYTRIIPGALVPENISDCIMCFYKTKETPLNYIVWQTTNKKTFDKYFNEMTKSGYIMKGNETKGDELKALYVKGKYNISVTKGRPTPKDPLIYMLGVRIVK